MTNDEKFMLAALKLARRAAGEGEVPVGCVVVKDGVIVGRGRNRRETGRSATAHAELRAIETACKRLGGWRLWECELYVTLEPCPMCAGAIVNSRIRRVVYGASDPKAGAAGSVLDLFSFPLNHRPEVVSGVMAEECSAELKKFFAGLRARR
ncbi:MAG: tRNA adenosine(34) deaminase TadA [Clostridiales bacterium]|nr:tRNA adenosine(34) deaminase TadA [Clostridiales bacterium]